MSDEQKIDGYKELDEQTVHLVNGVKRWENELGSFVQFLRETSVEPDPRRIDVAVTHFETAFMFLTKALTKPESQLK